MNELFLYGSVGESFWGEDHFTPKMVRDQLAEMSGPITVRINSGGGVATDGQSIHNLLVDYQDHITVIVDGIAASAASLIAMAGDTIKMHEGSILMIHDPAAGWTNGRGTEADHQQTVNMLAVLASAYARVYATRAKITVEAARDVMRAETYFEGQAAIDAGFADEVISKPAQQMAAFQYGVYAHAPRRLLASQNGRATASPASKTEFETMLDVKGLQAISPQFVASVRASMRAKGIKGITSEKLEMFAPLMADETAPSKIADLIAYIDSLVTQFDKASEMAEIIREVAEQLQGGSADEDEEEDAPSAMQLVVKAIVARTAKDIPVTASIRPGAPRYRTSALDAGTTMRAGVEGALVARMTGARVVRGPEREYMDMSLPEMCAHFTGRRGSLRTAGDRVRAVEMALGSHSGSDFPAIFENAMNKSLLAAYQAALPSYPRIATRMDFRDFRPHPVVGVGDFPMLHPIGETGEIKYGTISESKEARALVAYAVAFSISRQMMVDDDLGAVERILSDRGRAVASFEDKTFYAMALSGANSDGPTLLQTTRQVFNTTDGSKSGTGAALSVTSLSAAWAALRKRKSLDGNDLELQPAILLVGPDLEFAALQLLADINATKSTDVNPYSGKLEVVVTSKIIGNAWHLFADPAAAPCFTYGYLEGEEGPRMRMDEPFGQQGMRWSVELDFGVGAIDWRGGFKNAGA